MWRLCKCVYGLAGAPRQWYLCLSEELIGLGCVQHKIDKGLFFFLLDNQLASIITCFVDDILYGETIAFKTHIIDKLEEIFHIGTTHSDAFTYLGISLVQNKDNSITINQNKFVKSLQLIDIPINRKIHKHDQVTDNERTQLRSAIGQLNWVSGMTRPDINFSVCALSTKVKSATIAQLIEANKIIKNVQRESVSILFPKLDTDSIHFRLYCDASFNNLSDGGSQGGHIIFLCDVNENCTPISWTSARIKRVVRSTLAAETLAMSEGCNSALYCSNLLGNLANKSSKLINVLTDNKSLYDSIYSRRPTTDKRLCIEISALREMVDTMQIDVKVVPSKEQLSDVLTKKGASPTPLISVLQSGKLYMVSSQST